MVVCSIKWELWYIVSFQRIHLHVIWKSSSVEMAPNLILGDNTFAFYGSVYATDEKSA